MRRDVVAMYKQTVLGPVWFFIEPLFTTLVYIVIFGQIAKLGTGGVPQVLFYLSGLISGTTSRPTWWRLPTPSFKTKHSFPKSTSRTQPLCDLEQRVGSSSSLHCSSKVFYVYYMFTGMVQPTVYIFLFPVLVVLMAGLGLAGGMLVSAMTTHKDLAVLLRFSIQLFRYVSTVIFPLAMLSPKFKVLILSNPMSSSLRFRVGASAPLRPTLGCGTVGYSALFVTVLMVLGIAVFHKVEKKFIDTA